MSELNTSPLLYVNNLRLRVGGHDWHHHLQVLPGELVVVMGASGSGKTSLLEALAGFLPIQSGSILIEGQAMEQLPPEQRPISLLFQQQNFFEHLPVIENLQLGFPKARPNAAQWQAVLDACQLLQVEGLLQRLPSELSGGQKQRLALIRTVLRPQPVVLLDEPFSALDDAMRQTAGQWLKQTIKVAGQVALLVSHRQEDADTLADQLLLI
ncbi:ATP-binding cassette domain-containing protein [Marinospirillum alkaliphilum]|uniref:ATP-binding cassette domain-containing protein n=1 Tax=Marinospirillum alkaliphilum TaxID=148454 RepID=UPI0015A710C9|nr:ATP-binding cassette domain-containing protein [Marinospirillum alkaliphilum]